MPTTAPTSPASSTSEDAGPSAASPAQEPEPPEPENGSLPDSPGSLLINILISERVPADQPVGAISSSIAPTLHTNVRQAAHLLNIKSGAITINLITDDEMIELHTQFCHDNTTTDILTFDLDDHVNNQAAQRDQTILVDWSPFAFRANLGLRSSINADIALCVDQAQRQARARNHALINEFTLYAVHGLLHLLGHDDHDPDAYETMHELEDEILQTLGLPATFTD